MTNERTAISVVLNGREVTRDDVLAWEAKRLPKAAAKIGLPVPAGDLARQRLAFADSKLALGPPEIRRRLSRDIRFSGIGSRTTARLSGGRRATSVCELHVTGGGAAEFVRWFEDTARGLHPQHGCRQPGPLPHPDRLQRAAGGHRDHGRQPSH